VKIKYEFITGEVVEIEVSDDICEVSIEIEREIYNSDRRETRRHESYSDDNDKQEVLIDTSVDVEAEVFSSLDYKDLYRAIAMLERQQQELVDKVFFEERTMADIAREEGVSSKAIQDRVNKIKSRIRKIVENNLI